MKCITLKQNVINPGFKFIGFGPTEEKVFLINSRFLPVLLDRICNPFFSIPHTIKISDFSTRNEYQLKKKFNFLFERYLLVSQKGQLVATITRSKKLIEPEIHVNSIKGEFVIDTDIFARTFKVYHFGCLVAEVKKTTVTLSDSYRIHYDDLAIDGTLVVALTTAFDNMFHN